MSPRKANARPSFPFPDPFVAAAPPGPVPSPAPRDWRLPSGQSLAEFALDGGLIAPRLLRAGAFPAEESRQKR